MTKPQHGRLAKVSDSMWHFIPGHKALINYKRKPIELPDFLSTATSLFQSKNIMNKWINNAKFNENYSLGQAQQFAIRRMILQNSIEPTILTDEAISIALDHITPEVITTCHKVSASELDCTIPPKSLKHHQSMSPKDKDIWDRSYMEEYFGLHNTTHTWDYISE